MNRLPENLKFTPSKYQQSVFDQIQNTDTNILINAVAGSGKSTTLIQSLNLIPEGSSVLFLAFNKSIVEYLESKIGDRENVEVRTLHSLGTRILLRNGSEKVDGNKYRDFIYRSIKSGILVPDVSPDEVADYVNNLLKLIDLVRVNRIMKADQVKGLAAHYGIDLIGNESQIVMKVIKWGAFNRKTLDFTDMVYLPVVLGLNSPKYDYVFIDECQDLNAAQRELFLNCLKPESRFIAVGDPHQAIYGFAGADIHSFNLLKDLPNTVSLPLSVCYRCDAEIVRLAKILVPNIEPKEGAKPGTINYNAEWTDVRNGDMVLCRLTHPLVTLCMEFLKMGIKAYVKGRDIGQGLIKLVAKSRAKNKEDLDTYFEDVKKIKISKIMKIHKVTAEMANGFPSIIKFNDSVHIINIIYNQVGSISELLGFMEKIFDDNKKGIQLSTIHKSKGLESKRVFILDPDLFRHPKSMEMDWSARQEDNLIYVAYTRAKNYLGFINEYPGKDFGDLKTL